MCEWLKASTTHYYNNYDRTRRKVKGIIKINNKIKMLLLMVMVVEWGCFAMILGKQMI